MASSASAASSSKPRPDDRFEPDAKWKADLKKRIEENLKGMVQDAKDLLEDGLRKAPTHRDRLHIDFNNSMDNIRKLADDTYREELERERQERRWAMGADLNPAWKESIEKEQQAILDMIKSGKGSVPPETQTADASDADAISEPQQPSPVPDDRTSESPPSPNVSERPTSEQEGADVFGLDTESLTQPPLQRQSIRAGKQKEHDTPRFSSESPPTRSGERYSRPIQDRSPLTAFPKPSPERDTSSSGRSFDRSNRSSVELHPPKSSPSSATPYWHPKSDDSPSQSNLQRRTSTSSRSEEQSSHYGLQRRGSTASQRSIGSTGFRPSSATIPIPETDPGMARRAEQEKRALHEVDQQLSRLESAREKSKDRVGSGSYEYTAYDYSNHSPGPGSVSSSPSQSRRPPTPPMGTKPVYRKPSFMQESTRGVDRRPSIPTLAGGPSLISASRPPDSYGVGMPSQFDNARQGTPININPYGISNTMAYATDSPANYYPPYAPPTSYNADSPAREADRYFTSTPSSPPGHYPIQSTGPMYIPGASSNGEEDFNPRYYHPSHGQSSYRGQGWAGPGPDSQRASIEAQAWRSWIQPQPQPLGPRYSNSDLRSGQPIRPSAYHNHRDYDPGFDDLDDFEEEDLEQEYGPQSESAHWRMLESRRREEKKRQAADEEALKQAEEIKRKQREHARKKELEEKEKKERTEKERLEKERLEKEKLEQERLEKERLEKELEMERLEKERLERERERLERQRLENEKLERERREKEERERLETLEREREKERERLRVEEERKKKEEEARRKAEELRRREEELERKKQEAAQRKREAELRKKEEEIKRKEEEFARIQEEEMKLLREENQKKEEELKRQAQEAKKKEQEAKRREKEARKKEQEARKKEEEISQREAELSAREEELKRRESQAEEERRRLKEEEEMRMRKEAEMKRAREQEERKRTREVEKRRQREEEERRQREAEKRRQREEEERRQREEERQQREEEERRQREQQERWLKEEEERRLKMEEEERQRKEEEERRQREEEENRLRAEEELRQSAEAKRLEDERKSEELARKMWEEEQRRAQVDDEWSRREEAKKKSEAREAAARAIRERQEAEALRQQERMEAQWKKMQDERKREEETRKQEDRKREEEARKNLQDSSKSSEFGWANWSSASSAATWQSQRPSNGTSTPNRSASNSASSAWSGSSKSSSASSASARTSASSTASAASWATSNTSDTSSSSTPTPKARSGSTGASGTPFSEAEWQRRQEEFSRQQQERFIQEQDRLERERLNRAAKVMTKEDVVVMFDNHERLWQRMSTLDQLRWDHFPWPMFKKPASPEEITFTAISAYILSPHYPEKDKSRPEKDRIKEHIRRWHPDRFETKMLPKVIDVDKEKVREGAGFVVRSLNDLLTKSNTRPF